MKIDEKLIDEGYISKRRHPSAPYYIYNYTHKAQYEQKWNLDTLRCRGLILDEEGNIIARPFTKFFNYEEYSDNSKLGMLPKYKSFEIAEKLDGSLIILYTLPNGEIHAATRGSFEGEQALVGTDILREKYSTLKSINKDLTYIFEIIYKENRIVIDYGDKRDLYLLTIIDNKTGIDIKRSFIEHFSRMYKFPTARQISGFSNDLCDVKKFIDLNESNSCEEGFVIKFDTGFRVKLKYADYKRLHKIITGVSTKTIWEILREDRDTSELVNNVPDEFMEWVKTTLNILQKDYVYIETICKDTLKYMSINGVDSNNMKDVAQYFIEDCPDYCSICFAMFKNKPYKDIIWKLLKPKYKKPFKEEK